MPVWSIRRKYRLTQVFLFKERQLDRNVLERIHSHFLLHIIHRLIGLPQKYNLSFTLTSTSISKRIIHTTFSQKWHSSFLGMSKTVTHIPPVQCREGGGSKMAGNAPEATAGEGSGSKMAGNAPEATTGEGSGSKMTRNAPEATTGEGGRSKMARDASETIDREGVIMLCHDFLLNLQRYMGH